MNAIVASILKRYRKMPRPRAGNSINQLPPEEFDALVDEMDELYAKSHNLIWSPRTTPYSGEVFVYGHRFRRAA